MSTLASLLMRRYPLEPLLDAMRMTLSQAARALGIGGPEYRKFACEGMTRDTAERKAVKAGFHPYVVWPDMADHDLEETDRSRRAADARRKRKQYRRRRGVILERNRRYRQEAARAIKASRRVQYQRNAEKERERARAYYWAHRDEVLAKRRATREGKVA